MNEKKIKKVAIYARVSTNKKEDDPHYQETENQLALLREHCKREKWEVVKEYVDNESGKSGKRKNFQVMFKDAQKHKFDLVIFWALDRFSREGTLATLHYLQELEHYGVYFYSYTETYLNSVGVFRDVVISILATIAKQERIRHSERVKAGLERAKKEGRKLGRKPIDKKILKKIDGLRKKGLSIRQIAEELKISVGTVGERVKKRGKI